LAKLANQTSIVLTPMPPTRKNIASAYWQIEIGLIVQNQMNNSNTKIYSFTLIYGSGPFLNCW